MLKKLFNITHMIFIYLINCILLPCLILPFSLILKIFNYQTQFWNLTTYIGFFKLLNIKYKVDGKFIKKGFILSNHRTFCDFVYDPYISGASVVGRSLAFISVLFASIIGIIDNRFIIVDRNKPRHIIFEQIINFIHSGGRYSNRILFYPEGTRKSHKTLTLEETKNIIKPGLLKSIYEYKMLPVKKCPVLQRC
jgi:1-acyl-sn-glycerol-3-phosphate acyltransferase